MVSLYLIFYACLELRFPDVETNPGPQRPVPSCSVLFRRVPSCSFLFVGDLNGHHQEWLCSTTTNLHGVAQLMHVEELLIS